MSECKKCGFKYSSYCIGCMNVKQGLALTDKEYEDYLRKHKSKN